MRREDSITVNLKGTVCDGVKWIELAHDTDQWRALVITVMKILTS